MYNFYELSSFAFLKLQFKNNLISMSFLITTTNTIKPLQPCN